MASGATASVSARIPTRRQRAQRLNIRLADRIADALITHVSWDIEIVAYICRPATSMV